MPHKVNSHTYFRFSIRCIGIVLLTLLFNIYLTGCSRLQAKDSSNPSSIDFITRSEFLLNTVVTIQLYDKQDEDILAGCFDLISKYELVYSRTDKDSELYKLNHRLLPMEDNAYLISEELSDLLSYGLSYCRISDGTFDITIGSVSSLWKFTRLTPVIPLREDLLAALDTVDYQTLELKEDRIIFHKDGVQIDLGAIAKGYIADRVKDYLLSNGVSSAMINLGGNVLCVGEKPDGSSFHVGIQKPFGEKNETIAILDIRNLSVVSSGSYERYFEVEGITYHHILNPKTGYPVDNNLISVTIISKQSMDGDGLSTSCYVLGLEKGLKLIESLPYTYAIFVTSDNNIHYSKGLKEAFNVYEP